MDPDYGQTMAGDQALMESLEALAKYEAEVEHLKKVKTELDAEVKRLKENYGNVGHGSGQEQQVAELLRVNHQWDTEYREQEQAFKQYRIDSQQAQQENQAYIAKLKEEKDYLNHEIAVLKRQLSKGSNADHRHEIEALKRESAQKDHIIGNLKQKIRSLEEQLSHRGPGVDMRRVRQLEEEYSLLKRQVTAYREDFEAEKRDKDRLADEKQSLSLRHDAEITSLKLQLDRCRNELQHYSTEATRLAQQLRLKQQYEKDQFKQHLESRGYVSRGSNGLPPLDPFVEHDPPSYVAPMVIEPPSTTSSNSPKPLPRKNVPQRRDNFGNQLLARSSDSEESSSAPSSMGRDTYHKIDTNRTSTPSPNHFRRYSHNSPVRVNGNQTLQNGHSQNGVNVDEYEIIDPIHASSNPLPNGHPEVAYPPNTHNPKVVQNNRNGYIMQNGEVVQNMKPRRVVVDSSEDSGSVFVDSQVNGVTHTNGYLNSPAKLMPPRVNSDGHLNGMTNPPLVDTPKSSSFGEVDGQRTKNGSKDRTQKSESEAHRIPPMQTKGRHKCPRCARKFQRSADCEDHKARCIS